MARPELLERYRALPMPTTADESWRFTDLRGFDPDAFASNGHVSGTVPRTMLELDVSGLATVTADGVEIGRAPDGVVFERLDESHERLGQLIGADEKFAAHNAEEVETPNVTLAFWNPESDGEEFVPSVGGFALRVGDVAQAVEEVRAAGAEVIGIDDTGVCHMGFVKDFDGNTVILHRRYASRG